MKKIAILGYGVVGGGVAEVIDTNRAEIEAAIGEEIEIKYILDLRDFPGNKYESALTKDFNDILGDPEVVLVAEAMGGSHPAYDFSLAALKAGKNVVTSNKEVVANFGAELLNTAKENGVRYLFEASVGGGIPIIRPLIESLAGNRICSVAGILNGTTNYILTEMSENGKTFEIALKEAQEKGYAEKDPTADVDGIDAKRKICILSAISFGKMYGEDVVKNEGIRNIELTDVKILAGIGAKIKLVGKAVKTEQGIAIDVAPRVVRYNNPLRSVDGVFNGILVNGNALGDVMFYGSGAGKLPTASAVVSDIMDILTHPGAVEKLSFEEGSGEDLVDTDALPLSYYVRTEAKPQSYEYECVGDKAIIIKNISKNDVKANFAGSVFLEVM
ncbi:MAG: homoserine dehydrogenase [Clostridia bacterium]|nr:homoserine dehydrogenase [Clostridia bacterium]